MNKFKKSKGKFHKAEPKDADMSPAEFFEAYSMPVDQEKLQDFFNYIDKFYQAYLARLTAGISPAAVQMDIYSWLAQLAQSPGHLMELSAYPFTHCYDCFNNALQFYDKSQKIDDVRL